MGTLVGYNSDTRDLVRDASGNFWTDSQINRYVNLARKQVAKESQCVRILPPSTASISTITITNGGSGYTYATVTISGPDAIGQTYTTATATATILGGQITAITITNVGTGYVATPTVTITGNGSNAAATATLTPRIATVSGQERYLFSTFSTVAMATTPGAGAVLGIQDISVSWGAMKPTLDRLPWSTLQAYARSYNLGFQNYPKAWAQLGQGAQGSAYLWPIPSQVAQMDVDCYCSVDDLSDSQVVDLIPEPWDAAVPYYAAYLAYWNAQRKGDAAAAKAEYVRLILEARTAAGPSAWVPAPYGDW